MVVDPQPEAAQIRGESRAARRERDLRQKPEGVEKRRIAGGNLKALLGRIRSRRRNALDVCVNLQKVDDLSPFFGLRERTETNVTHGRLGRDQTDIGRPTGRTQSELMLTPCLPDASSVD